MIETGQEQGSRHLCTISVAHAGLIPVLTVALLGLLSVVAVAADIEDGKTRSAPELDRRIETYLRYYDRYGAILVQMNVEDTANGVAEYVIDKYGDKVIIELKWGQGAKDIGGEIQVTDLDYARFLKDRGYVVDPDASSFDEESRTHEIVVVRH